MALLAKGLLGVPVMTWLRQCTMRQRCRLPVVIWAFNARPPMPDIVVLHCSQLV